MKIGFNLLLWSTHIVDEDFPTIEKLKAAGYDGVELPIFDTSDPKHFSKIGQVVRDNGMTCTAVTVCPDEERNPISPVAANRQGAIDHLKTAVDCCHNAGVEVLCGPYYQVLAEFTGDFPTEQEREHAAEVHRVIAAYAEDAGVRCAIEPLNRFESHLLNTNQDASDYVDRVGHPNFHYLYDTFHSNIEEKDPVGSLEKTIQNIGHIHISENDRGAPGEGHCPIRETIQLAKKLGYDNWFTIEAFGASLPDLAAATKVWRDFFPSKEHVYEKGIEVIREAWDSA